ncbi:MAG: EMC3/TMCO1 family protein [Candidatus Methanoplasma sp.]|jgi:uncharacterized membrane protein (DUF106 family)|nr:EMC3/TMCO1 family protein [Candidatus Methanoplasma sp.]
MPNPGSPQSMQQAQSAMPQMMSKGTIIGMVATMIILVVVMQFRMQIGQGLNFAFEPLIGFGGNWPVVTLVIAGLIMITLSTLIRSYMTDFVAQARNQKISSEFNKEMRQARLENNLYKLKKLQEEQPKMMAKSMESSTTMMKTMPITMLVVIPIYAWVWYFLQNVVSPDLLSIHLPFAEVNLLSTLWILPMWIVIYTMISLPIGQLENRVVRYFLLQKRLKELDGNKI